ncbi:tRNA (adenine(22)-N(1))-methyltransferase [Cohnella massiliensis]|uniref:tRNA (adenine(22)-N(1))-methyltransferase n=1 Tax=Cohnella massiliensis TaxID=1816691 RepID=UPI0009BBB6DF|nr:class I SAM-dependent methyltransferase [Cohnella massiliensis]
MPNEQMKNAGVKLSARLAALADLVPEGARLADIGTDHALLPVFLAATGKISFAVAGDVHAGPVEAARRQVAEAGLDGAISVRMGDGMSVLDPGEVDTVCIAGMGGSLIVRILEAAGSRLDGVDTLVLSPHVAEDQVRRWLRERGFVLDIEELLEEDGEIYTLLRAKRAGDGADAERRNAELYGLSVSFASKGERFELPPDIAYAMGPLLLREGGELFRRKWSGEIAKRDRILEQLRLSEAPETAEKAKEWERTTTLYREVLACLPAERRLSN